MILGEEIDHAAFEKIAVIILEAKRRFGLELWAKHAQAGVNPHSGNTWVWNEDVPVSFFLPIGKNTPDCIRLCYIGENEEYLAYLTDFATLDEVYAWVQKIAEDEVAEAPV